MKPAIVVVGFNRLRALERLLAGVLAADFSDYEEVPLVISLDGGDCKSVRRFAERISWHRGPFRLIVYAERLGLREHILRCGDLVEEYGNIILLEDDLAVSPHFYSFAASALKFYSTDERIAGVSLYSFGYQEFSRTPFIAYDDGQDVYFLQSASSSGQCWTAQQWGTFRRWYKAHSNPEQLSRFLPTDMLDWPESSWKKYFNSYLQLTGRYFVIPRRSYTTNMGEAGTHFKRAVSRLTVPLAVGRPRFNFVGLNRSFCRYDSFFEIEADCLKEYCPELDRIPFCVDLYGTKDPHVVTEDYILTIKPARSRMLGFGFRYFPPELNIIFRHFGRFLSLAPLTALGPLTPTRSRRLRRFYDCG